MGIDVIFGPADGFHDWTSDQWDEFSEHDATGDRLGSYTSVGGLLETVSANLENGEPGSRFPLVMRLVDSEAKGWYHGELADMLVELGRLRTELASVPLDRLHFVNVSDQDMSIRRGTPEDVAGAKRDFEEVYPGRPLQNAADFHHYFLETLESLASRALMSGAGLVIQ
jgi:hypothetical protein